MNTLKTQLKDSIFNDNQQNQLILNFTNTSNISKIFIKVKKETNLTITNKDGYFCDSEGISNLGKTKTLQYTTTTEFIYFKNVDSIKIDNKYNITKISISSINTLCSDIYVFDGLDLDLLNLIGQKCNGYIGALNANIKEFYVSECMLLKGSIDEHINNNKTLEAFLAVNTKLEGELDKIKSNILTNITISASNVKGGLKQIPISISKLYISNTLIKDDIANANENSNLTEISFYSTGIYGDISGLLKFPNLQVAQISSFMYGDLSNMPTKLHKIEAVANDNIFTWNQDRDSSSTIIALQRIKLGNYVDAYLNNICNCVVGTTKKISIHGTRTSSSDNAVSKLKQLGYIVNVNGINL